ncbi:hypothetical protein [Parahaliea mediterranea]|uniref:hypothetical protein n=1 Tax=Parahaliea mediterranea TaxID=651086 RepID=UPI0013005B4F|nr:hypothetical protein [Parahaliea mediterranea]
MNESKHHQKATNIIQSSLKRWDKFAAEHLDPAPDKRVGRRLIESGEIKGEFLNGWPWVDMNWWETRHERRRVIEFEDENWLH